MIYRDLPNEVMAIMTLISGNDKPAGLLAGALREEHFYDARCRELYIHIMALAARRKKMPTHATLQHSTALTEEARELIDEDAYPPVPTEGDAEQVVDVLDRCRQGRVVLETYDDVMKVMEADEADPEEGLKVMEQGLLEARCFEDVQNLNVSDGGNFLEATAELLGRDAPNVVPSGFHEFDESAGGFPRGGLTTLAATSGGGKTCLSLQVAINVYNQNMSVAIVTLEMSKEQTTGRMLSNLSGVNYKAINKNQTDESQNLRINKAAAAFQKKTKDGARLDIYHKSRATIDEIALQMRALRYDLIIVDYINLLEEPEEAGGNQAKALGDISKAAKLHAGSTNAAWIMLAQLNEDGQVKYSRAIRENSDYMLTWTYGDAEKESHLVELHVQKARHSEEIKFVLRENFKCQKFENPGNPEHASEVNIRKSKPSAAHATARPMPGLEFEDDEDDL